MATSTNRRPTYNKQQYRGQAYVYGNTVRKPEWTPQRREEIFPKEQKRVSVQVRKNRKKAMHMNKAYVFFLTIAAIIVLAVCVNYLQLQAELSNRSARVTAMQKELAEKREMNNTRMNSAMDSVNLEEVRKKATKSMGMKRATSEQIVTYERNSGNYVKQYKDIPENGLSIE